MLSFEEVVQENAVIAQSVEHIHGKNEVIGSIPINGSIKKSRSMRDFSLSPVFSRNQDIFVLYYREALINNQAALFHTI